MTENFRPREVLSHLSGERVIAGVKIKGESGGAISVSYRGWSFLFSDGIVQIEMEKVERVSGWQRYLIATKEKTKGRSSCPVLNICETGALTITIDTEGAMTMRSFLKKDLPFRGGP